MALPPEHRNRSPRPRWSPVSSVGLRRREKVQLTLTLGPWARPAGFPACCRWHRSPRSVRGRVPVFFDTPRLGMATTLGVKRLPCMGARKGRKVRRWRWSGSIPGRSLFARAPVVRCTANSPFRVSPGLRPHRRHRCASLVVIARSTIAASHFQKPMRPQPESHEVCYLADWGSSRYSSLIVFSTKVLVCHEKSSSSTCVLVFTLLWALALPSLASAQDPLVPNILLPGQPATGRQGTAARGGPYHLGCRGMGD